MHDYTMILAHPLIHSILVQIQTFAHPMGEPLEPQIPYPELHLDFAR